MTMHGFHPLASMYFIILTLLGAFYIANLFLAVLWETYSTLQSTELTPEQQLHQAQLKRAGMLDPEGENTPLVPRRGGASFGRLGSGGVSLLPAPAAAPALAPTDAVGLGCCGRLRRQIDSRSFRLSIFVLIGVNTLVMMLERHPMPASERELIEHANLVFFCAYVIEMALKLCALGVNEYLADNFNRFDGLVVLLSCAEIATTYLYIDLGLNTQVLRAFRLLRVFKLARSWNSLFVVIRTLLNMLSILGDLLVVLFLVLFVFAMLGMQMFGGRLHDVAGRNLYDTIESAMATVFVVVTGEAWDAMWITTQRVLGRSTAWYYLLLVAIGDYVILNLIVAIVIGEVVQSQTDSSAIVRTDQKPTGFAIVRNAKVRIFGALMPRIHKADVAEAAGEGEEEEEFWGCERSCGRAYSRLGTWLEARHDYSLWIFAPESFPRVIASWMLHARIPYTPITIEVLVLSTIIVSSGVVALTEGCGTGRVYTSVYDQQLHEAHASLPEYMVPYLVLATLISLVEIGAKVVCFGLVGTEQAYLTSGWNQLDLAIAMLCVFEIVESGMPSGLVLRAIHVLRPIRLIARLGRLQKIMRLLYELLPRVGNILLVYMVFLSVFAVLGVQLFAGMFGACTKASDGTHHTLASDATLTSKAACEAAGEVWRAAPDEGSFDNFLSAALVLFEMSSFEAWDKVMYLGIDAVGVDVTGRTDYNPWAALFFIAWVFIGGLIILNVFVGVLIDTFATMEAQDHYGAIFTSHEQQHWLETLEASTLARPLKRHRRPQNAGCRQWLYDAITSQRFETLILSVILANTALMAMDGEEISPWLSTTLDQANDVCTAIFVLEALLKLITHGFIGYMSEPWNVFDLIVVTIAVGEKLLLAVAAAQVKGSLLRIVRLARAARVLRTLRLVKSSREVQALLMTLLYSFPALVDILSIFCIIMFVYSVLGMQLLAGIKYGEHLNENANFCSFPKAFLTMFRCATGEDWNGIMHDATVSPERGCDETKGECGTPLAIPFFISYIILASFVVLKMLVALIIENFKKYFREEARLIRPVHRDKFVEAWGALDPDGVGQLPIAQLPALIRQLPVPLGPARRRGRLAEKHISLFILSLDIVAYEQRGGGKVVLFHDLLLALTHRALDEQRKTSGVPIIDSPSTAHLDIPPASFRDPAGLDTPASSHRPSDSPEFTPRRKGASSHRSTPQGSHRNTLLTNDACASPAKIGGSASSYSLLGGGSLGELRDQFQRKARLARRLSWRNSDLDLVQNAPAAIPEEDELDDEVMLVREHRRERSHRALSHRQDTQDEDEDDVEEDRMVFSLHQEYAVTVIQARWRQRQIRRNEQVESKQLAHGPAAV